MATPLLLERFDSGQQLQPMNSGHVAKTDAAAFAPNLTIRYGQAVAQNATTKLLYPYSTATLTAPAAPAVTTAPTGGTLAAGTYLYKVEAVYGTNGNSAASAESTSVTAAGTTSANTLTWTGLAGATGYNVYGTAANGSSGSETFISYVPPPQTSTTGNVTYVDAGSAHTTATPPTASTAPTDGTQTCIGLSEYSFSTDANGVAYLTFVTAAGQTSFVGPSVRDAGQSTMPYYYRGPFDPRDLVGFDAAAAAALGARTLASGVVLLP